MVTPCRADYPTASHLGRRRKAFNNGTKPSSNTLFVLLASFAVVSRARYLSIYKTRTAAYYDVHECGPLPRSCGTWVLILRPVFFRSSLSFPFYPAPANSK